MGKSVSDEQTLKVKAGIYTVAIDLTEELQNILPEPEWTSLGGRELLSEMKSKRDFTALSNLPDESIKILIDHSPDLMCSIIRQKSKWSRRRNRHVPLSAFLPYLPCHHTKDSEQAIDEVFWEFGDYEAIVQELLQGKRKTDDLVGNWQLLLQVEQCPNSDDWSVYLWIYNTKYPSVVLPVSDEALRHSWMDDTVGLSRPRLKTMVRSALDTAVDVCPVLHQFERNPSLSARTGTGVRYKDPDSPKFKGRSKYFKDY